MRVNFGAKPYSFPMPVYIIGTYDENNVPNAMNAAWGGICDDQKIMICIDSTHKTAANLQKSGAFTVSIGDAAHYTVGISYDRSVDRLKRDERDTFGTGYFRDEELNKPEPESSKPVE